MTNSRCKQNCWAVQSSFLALSAECIFLALFWVVVGTMLIACQPNNVEAPRTPVTQPTSEANTLAALQAHDCFRTIAKFGSGVLLTTRNVGDHCSDWLFSEERTTSFRLAWSDYSQGLFGRSGPRFFAMVDTTHGAETAAAARFATLSITQIYRDPKNLSRYADGCVELLTQTVRRWVAERCEPKPQMGAELTCAVLYRTDEYLQSTVNGPLRYGERGADYASATAYYQVAQQQCFHGAYISDAKRHQCADLLYSAYTGYFVGDDEEEAGEILGVLTDHQNRFQASEHILHIHDKERREANYQRLHSEWLRQREEEKRLRKLRDLRAQRACKEAGEGGLCLGEVGQIGQFLPYPSSNLPELSLCPWAVVD